jgi:molybdopterin-guanine dinucleotide biosynthesis protein A
MKENINIYILAGGKSSRMVTDKATKMFHGKQMIEHVLDVIKNISLNIFILSNHKEHEQFGYECIIDEINECGPASGIDAMLHHTNQENNFIVSCDMPFIDEVSIRKIILASGNFDITIPMLNNYPEALIGVYHKSCKALWRKELLKNERKLSTLINHFKTNYVDGNELQKQNPLLFSNFNSLKDIEAHEQ